MKDIYQNHTKSKHSYLFVIYIQQGPSLKYIYEARCNMAFDTFNILLHNYSVFK